MRIAIEAPAARLDAFLAQTQPQHSRSYWQQLCEQGKVTVNNKIVPSKAKLKIGDVVDIQLPEIIDFTGQELPVIYEDNDVIVINKPAGILTHAKGVTNLEFSVAEFARPRTTDAPDNNRPGIVHRLDRGTSGLIIVAKNALSKLWLQKQFSQRKAKKTYTALIEGHLSEPSALIQLPIERNPKKPQSFRVGSNGKSAETFYETVRVFANYTLVRLRPTTGRTHQLRVHMAHLKHPIVGDELYGRAQPKLGRMFLHAAELELTLPSRERKVFTAPLPSELQTFLDSLQ